MSKPFDLRQLVSGAGFATEDQDDVTLVHWVDATFRIWQQFECGSEGGYKCFNCGQIEKPFTADEIALIQAVRKTKELMMGCEE